MRDTLLGPGCSCADRDDPSRFSSHYSDLQAGKNTPIDLPLFSRGGEPIQCRAAGHQPAAFARKERCAALISIGRSIERLANQILHSPGVRTSLPLEDDPMPNLPYLWLAARLKLGPIHNSPRATYAGVTFAVESTHYQLRSLLKQQAIQPVLAQLLSLCDAHTLFVDIGANIGIFSLLVASESGAQVLAIEPVRSTFHALVRNCRLNPALFVTPLNVALGAVPRVVDMTALPSSGINHVTSLAEHQGESRQTAIQLSLDQLCLQELARDFEKVVIKIDVERYEFEVLAGMQQLLGGNLPIALCVEAEQDQHPRLQSMLGSRYRALPATICQQSGLAVSGEIDLSNVFFVNSNWLAQNLIS